LEEKKIKLKSKNITKEDFDASFFVILFFVERNSSKSCLHLTPFIPSGFGSKIFQSERSDD